MIYRDFGTTGLRVSVLGYGAGQLGAATFSDVDAGRLLNEVVDRGITLIDTARGYGMSEERIGKHLKHRRHEIVLSTKVGYDIPGYTDWTYDCVHAGIDEALRRLQTDVLDIVHLHSCPRTTLKEGSSVRALEEAVRAGKVRVAAYSGENEALDWAVDSGRFESVEHSLNICDQRVIDGALTRSLARGLGVISKRPVANAPWRYAECPKGEYAEEYWWRWNTMKLDRRDLSWQELALRFTAFTPGVSSCIVGTTQLNHVLQNCSFLEAGPLAEDHRHAIRHAFRTNDPGWWVGQI
ncbi:MAG: aldo/keto reductase [Ignavibacteriales bacterium]|nr:aldo/keto reductase [Ignavibacteriales bacterium]